MSDETPVTSPLAAFHAWYNIYNQMLYCAGTQKQDRWIHTYSVEYMDTQLKPTWLAACEWQHQEDLKTIQSLRDALVKIVDSDYCENDSPAYIAQDVLEKLKML
jgi:hypothetical protein